MTIRFEAPPRGSSAWVIPCAFLVAVASIVGVAALQVRVDTSHHAQVALVQAHQRFDALQNVPFDVKGQTPEAREATLRRMLRTAGAIERDIAELRRASPNRDLDHAVAPYRENVAGLRRITALVAAGRDTAADMLGAESGRLQREVDGHLDRASRAYDERTSKTLTVATVGAGAAILILVCLFSLFYFRSRRAQSKALTLADQNSQILLQDAQLNVIHRLALAAEYRDDETGQHTRRVGDLSARIGAELGMPKDELRLLCQAAPLHDVGKIAVPDAILLKPGRLTPAEFDQM
jgi:HD-GYP domain-containing protein (c-di-GMP phosphodiesterase class II)